MAFLWTYISISHKGFQEMKNMMKPGIECGTIKKCSEDAMFLLYYYESGGYN